jgi:hypothetical protein
LGEETLSFSRIYCKSIDIDVKIKRSVKSDLSRLSSISETDMALDRTIRNSYGKVEESIVNQLICIQNNYPSMQIADILQKFYQQLEENPLEDDDYETFRKPSELIEEFRKGKLTHEEEDQVRGFAWKTFTKLDSFKKSNIRNYADLSKDPASDYNVECIKKDLPRVVPNHPYYSTDFEEGRIALRRVLETLSVYHQELGYFNGLGFITAIVLLYLSEEDTFWMINLMLGNNDNDYSL